MSTEFPPFYTRQPNTTVRQFQLEKWSEVVTTYCRENKISKVSPQSWQNTTLFSNPILNRRCHIEFIKEILKYMVDNSLAIPTSESSDTPNSELIVSSECHSGGYANLESKEKTCIILSYSVAEIVESLSQLPAQLYTGYELRDDQYSGYKFQKCPLDILKLSLNEMEKQKKVKLIKNNTFDESGIKIL
eukprot:NODE_306_length_11344_cov_0.675767.p6 type:complete len:189 gc:universal NODE_306_length_11344_cov_0.675767:9186-9752(+)